MIVNGENINKEKYEKDMKELEELRRQKEKTKANNGTLWLTLSILTIVYVLIPFLPVKTAITSIGALAGYIYIRDYQGSKIPLMTNLIVGGIGFVLRTMLWLFPIILLLPIFLI